MTTHTIKRLFAGLLFTSIVANVSAQQTKTAKPGVKKPNIGITVNAHDFNTKTLFPKKDSAYGFSVLFWKGITQHVDYSVRYNGIFPNENRNSVISKNGISNELELAFHAKAFPDKAVFNPFLTLGVGGGNYNKELAPVVVDVNKKSMWSGHALGGVGFQFNIKSELYLLAQAHYRYSFRESRLPHNMFYSVGLTRSLSKAKPKPVEVKIADRDNDGVADNIDACPDVAGIAALQGCPDKDGDGIADKDDACPDVAGVAALKGCADRDGDGIADGSDKCPDVKGLARYEGCPVPDTDKDGINDEQDKCVTVAGVSRYEGCPVPDGDNDGINDEEDKCPTVAGVSENQGCPAISEEVKKKVSTAATKILFVTGSSKLQSSSFKGLNEVAKIMNENPDMLLSVDGHTDNTGADEKNMVLSQNRADAVKAYLASKGVSADRITATGHGETMPVAENNTAKGRQQNRRSELTLSYFK